MQHFRQKGRHGIKHRAVHGSSGGLARQQCYPGKHRHKTGYIQLAGVGCLGNLLHERCHLIQRNGAKAEHSHKVFHNPIVCCCRCGQQPQIGWKRSGDTFQQSVVRTEVVTPIGNAMGLIDNHQRNLPCDTSQNLGVKPVVTQLFWRYQQNVHFVSTQLGFNRFPFILVIGVDGGGANPHPLCRCDLVSHQRQQRGDQ